MTGDGAVLPMRQANKYAHFSKPTALLHGDCLIAVNAYDARCIRYLQLAKHDEINLRRHSLENLIVDVSEATW